MNRYTPACGCCDPCCRTRTAPYPSTLYLNDGIGVVTLTGGIGGGWTGTATRTAAPFYTVDPYTDQCGTDGTSSGAISVQFILTCGGTHGWFLRIFRSSCHGLPSGISSSGNLAPGNGGPYFEYIDIGAPATADKLPSSCPPAFSLTMGKGAAGTTYDTDSPTNPVHWNGIITQ